MQNQALPNYQKVLTLSLGLGGIVNAFCLPALAKSGPEKLDLIGSLGSVSQSVKGLEPLSTIPSTESVEPFSVLSFAEEDELLEDAIAPSPRPHAQSRTRSLAAQASRPPRFSSVSWKASMKASPLSISRLSTTDIHHIDLSWGPSEAPTHSWIDEASTIDAPEVLESESLVSESLESEVLKSEVLGSEALESGAASPEASEFFLENLITVPLSSAEVAQAETETHSENDERSENDEQSEEEAQSEAESQPVLTSPSTPLLPTGSADASVGLDAEIVSEAVGDPQVVVQEGEALDDELGELRLLQLRSRENEELGILRLLQTAEAPPPPPKPPIAFLSGRLGFFSTENAFRSTPPPDRSFEEQIYQAGMTLYLLPRLSETTSVYAIAETNIARYHNFESVHYNELEFQLGLRQRLAPRTFAQIGWRNQRLYSPGYRERLFGVNYLDTLISHRSIINQKTWLDSFYQMRLGFADPQTASRFRQTFTLSFNHSVTRELRTTLLYQLDFDDYTQAPRYDSYQQILGIVSYNITPESRVSLFGGTRFGRSSAPGVNLDDTFYGAGLNVNLPLF
ncbi:MAG: hypothetical protein AAFY72_15110 [Cyanobacteria bacterium J06649_4]